MYFPLDLARFDVGVVEGGVGFHVELPAMRAAEVAELDDLDRRFCRAGVEAQGRYVDRFDVTLIPPGARCGGLSVQQLCGNARRGLVLSGGVGCLLRTATPRE